MKDSNANAASRSPKGEASHSQEYEVKSISKDSPSKSQESGMHYGAAPLIFKNAQFLRNNETQTEKILWERIRNRALGVKFRRQHPIGDYVVDFYCHKLKLVIEIDGNYHENPSQKRQDEFREDVIKELNIKIIRFSDESVINDTDSVVKNIKDHISSVGTL